jgi:hypothetical protein
VLAFAIFLRRDVLTGTLEDVLAEAAAHPNRQMEIGTLKDAYQPVFLYLAQCASCNDPDLKAASPRSI